MLCHSCIFEHMQQRRFARVVQTKKYQLARFLVQAYNHKLVHILRVSTTKQEAQPPQRQHMSAVITPFKVTDSGTSRKSICNFPLVNNTNVHPAFHHFKVTVDISQISAFDRGTSLWTHSFQESPKLTTTKFGTKKTKNITLTYGAKKHSDILNHLGIITSVTNRQMNRQPLVTGSDDMRSMLKIK